MTYAYILSVLLPLNILSSSPGPPAVQDADDGAEASRSMLMRLRIKYPCIL